MARTLVVVVVLVLAGCSTHGSVMVTSGTPGVSAGINIQSGSTAGALIGIGVLGALIYGESSVNGTRYRANPFLAIEPTTPAPPMDETRRVHEQDCTKPIEDWTANLRCR